MGLGPDPEQLKAEPQVAESSDSTAESIDSAPGRAAVSFIAVTLFIDVLGLGIVIPILPQLITQLAHSGVAGGSRTYGLLLSLYALMVFVFSPAMGVLSDQWGRRPVLLVSMLANGLDYILMAVSPTIGWLFFGRVVSGITGASITTATAYIADVTPPEKRAQSFGIVGAAFGIGFIVGPAIGALLAQFGPRAPFWGSALLSLLNWLYGLFILPESLKPENRRRFEWKRAHPVGAIWMLSRYPLVKGLTIAMICMSLGQQALQSTWVLHNNYRFHWDARQNGLSLAAVGLMSGIVQGGLMRYIIPWLGERRAVLVGIAANTAGFLMFGLAAKGWMMYPAIAIWSISFIMGPAMQALISQKYGAHEQGSVQGAMTSLNSVVGIAAPLAATALFAYFVSGRAPIILPGIAFFYGAALSLVALFVALGSFLRDRGARATAVQRESGPSPAMTA